MEHPGVDQKGSCEVREKTTVIAECALAVDALLELLTTCHAGVNTTLPFATTRSAGTVNRDVEQPEHVLILALQKARQ